MSKIFSDMDAFKIKSNLNKMSNAIHRLFEKHIEYKPGDMVLLHDNRNPSWIIGMYYENNILSGKVIENDTIAMVLKKELNEDKIEEYWVLCGNKKYFVSSVYLYPYRNET